MATKSIKEKECYWIPHPSKVFKMVMVRRIKGDSCHATTTDDNTGIDLDIPDCPFYPVNSTSEQDMTSLPYLHEAGILYNLQDRSQPHRHTPYTHISTVLVAVNPLQSVPDPSKELFLNAPLTANAPHPYGIAELAYRQMSARVASPSGRNQAIVLSGESGAGKTEISKIILRYLCWRSHSPAKSIDNCLAHSSAILESFGHAKTAKNNNSSRFGKCLKIQFESSESGVSSFHIVSANIDSHLLEKSRVVSVVSGERNFHVFYQLLAGANLGLKKKYRLKSSENYRYLNDESTEEEGSEDDSEGFVRMKEALTGMGIGAPEQDFVFRAISAVLSLGNVEFVEGQDDGSVGQEHDQDQDQDQGGEGREQEQRERDRLEVLGVSPAPPQGKMKSSSLPLEAGGVAQVCEPYVVEHVSELLGVPREALLRLLLEHSIDLSTLHGAGDRAGEHLHSPRTVAQAQYARDAMACFLYEKLFSWLVGRVNEALHPPHQKQADSPLPPVSAGSISVVDMFGFEDHEINGLQQLLINYSSEAMHLLFNKTVLEQELQMLVEEDVWAGSESGAAFSSNVGCLDVVATGKKSILSFLDSVCIRPGVEERVFLSLLHTNIKKNPFFPSLRSVDKKERFKVRHYARTVTYTVGSFIPRNSDITLTGLEELLQNSSFSTSKCSIFSPIGSGSANGSVIDPTSDALSNSDNPVGSPLQSVVPQRRGSMGLVTKQSTLGGTFISQISSLTDWLTSCSCSFIRCVKPNHTMTTGHFDPHCVVSQIRSLNVVQTCEVLKAGLPFCISIAEIENMFRPVLPERLYQQLHRLNSASARSPLSCAPSFVLALLWACQVPPDAYRFGKTKVFFKTGRLSLFHEVMAHTSAESNPLLANRLSFYITRIYFRKWMSRFVCERALVSLLGRSRKKLRAVCTIQKAWHGYFHSSSRLKRKAVKRRWRVAILRVRCCLVFMQEIKLQVEANEMRITAQAKAAEQIEKREAELQLLLEKEEAAMMEAFEENLERDKDIRISEGRVADSDDESVEEEEEGAFLLAVEEEDEFPTDLDDFSRARSRSHSASGTRSRNNSLGRSGNGSGVRRGSFGSTTGSTSVARRNASIANFGNTSVASIAKSEMDALIAASSLATVSVCLFRWQNIKKFTAFETWLDNVTAGSVGSLDGKSRRKRNSALARASMSFDKRHSLHEILEEPKAEDEGSNSGDKDIFDDSAKSISGAMNEYSPGDLSTNGGAEKDRDGRKKTAPLTRQNSSIAKVFSSVMTDNEDESDVDGSVDIDIRSPSPTRHSETDSPSCQEGGKAQLCFECTERVPVLYCLHCSEEYCKVCSQFVHDYCRHMKTHEVVDMSKKPMGVVQMRPSFISTGQTEITQSTPAVSKPVAQRVQPQTGEVAATSPDEANGQANPQRRTSRTFKTMGMITSAEESGGAKNHCAIRLCDKPATKGVSIRFCDEHYDEFRNGMKVSKQHDCEEGETDAKTLQQTIALLTKQLKESGQQPVEFVDLSVARERMQKAVERLMGGEEAAENDIERWDKAIKMNPDYQKEMEEKAKQWEIDQEPINRECYLQMRRLIPPDLHAASLGSMIEDGLPKTIANRIWTKKILGMICTHEGDIKRIHIVDLQTKYSNQGLDIVEMRAIWYVMPKEFDLDGDGKKAKWRDLFRQKLEELGAKEEGNRLSNPEKRNNAYKGHSELSIYDPTIEIKKKVIAKSTAFDATEKPDVNNKLGSGIKELRKQMGPEKPLISGPLLYLSGGSDNPDESRKVFANLFRQKKSIMLYPNADKAKDDEDCIEEVTIEKGVSLKLGPGSKTFCLMDGEKELKAFQSDKARREAWVAAVGEVITLLNTAKKVKKKKKVDEVVEVKSDEPPRPPRPSFLDAIGKKGGAGGDGGTERPPAPSFMDAIKNRKKGGDGGGGDRPAPPSFMDAIKNRKKPSQEGEERPAAPSFMDAIKNRKKEGSEEGVSLKPKPAAPSFMDAIKNRKKTDEEEGGISDLPKRVGKARKEEDI